MHANLPARTCPDRADTGTANRWPIGGARQEPGEGSNMGPSSTGHLAPMSALITDRCEDGTQAAWGRAFMDMICWLERQCEGPSIE